MSYYRLYLMDLFTGHIARFEELECSTDEEAVEWMQSHKGAMALELWNQHRKVARLESQDLAALLIARRRQGSPSEPSEHTSVPLAS